MTRPVVPNLYRIEVIQAREGQTFENVLWFLVDDQDAGAVALAAQAAWETTHGPIDVQSTVITYERTVVTDYSGADDPLDLEWDSGLQGHGNVSAGAPTPPNCCMVTTLKTGTGGRSGRGRLYLGGIGDTLLDSFRAQWDLAGEPDLVSAVQTVNDQMSSSLDGGRQQVVSFVVPSAPVARPVETWVAKSTVASQRRRSRPFGTL
jgi:hypothetical protein